MPESLRLARAASGAVWTAVFVVLTFVLAQLFTWTLQPAFTSPTTAAVGGLALAALASTAILPVRTAGGRWRGIGLGGGRQGLFEAAFGLGLGAAAAAGVITAGLLIGSMTVTTSEPPSQTIFETPPWGVPLILAVGAAGEELAVRGYAFQQLARALTPAGAAATGAAAFGLLHYGNPDATWLSMLNTALFGILFALAIARHRSLLMAYGLHLGWNLALTVLGAGMSGLTIRVTALEIVPRGPELWSGGSYGPEASLLATLAVVGLAVGVTRTPRLAPRRPLIWDDAWPPARRKRCDSSSSISPSSSSSPSEPS